MLYWIPNTINVKDKQMGAPDDLGASERDQRPLALEHNFQNNLLVHKLNSPGFL